MGLFDFFMGSSKKDTSKNEEKASTKPEKSFCKLPIDKIVKETDDAISVYFNVPEELREHFTYKAGQYITIRQTVNGQTVLRSYSLSSCPLNDDFLRIGIKRKPGGVLSGYLIDNLVKGQMMEVFPPLGSFTPDISQSSQTYFLYAGGSGITPIIGISKYLLHATDDTNIILHFANRTAKGIIYFDEIMALKEQFPLRFEVRFIIDEVMKDFVKNALGIDPLKGIFYADDYAREIKSRFPDRFEDGSHFICGPTPMMQEVEKALHQLRVNAGNIFVEYFEIEKQYQPSPDLPTITNPTPIPNPKISEGQTLAKVKLHGQVYSVVIPKGDTVLNACLDSGLDAPFMCESGVCTTCRATLVNGKVEMMACYGLNADEVGKGFILTCQSLPLTEEIEVSYD